MRSTLVSARRRVHGAEHEVAGLGRGHARARSSRGRAARRPGSRPGPRAASRAARRRTSAVCVPISRWLTSALLARVHELDRILERDDVPRVRPVDVVDQRGERRRLAGAGRPADQHQAVLEVGELRHDRRQARASRAAGCSFLTIRNTAARPVICVNTLRAEAQVVRSCTSCEKSTSCSSPSVSSWRVGEQRREQRAHLLGGEHLLGQRHGLAVQLDHRHALGRQDQVVGLRARRRRRACDRAASSIGSSCPPAARPSSA